MAQEIYNEGRVVGLSAWEIFYREAIGNGMPPEEVPDEHEWLTSMLGSGASMILKIPAGTTVGVHDYELPSGSALTAAGVIIANPFMGECTWDSSGWAKKVESYGGLIKNTDGSGNNPPVSGNNTVPYDTSYTASDFRAEITEFVKITDGIVFTKNANWVAATSTPPTKDIKPNFGYSSTVVRLYIHRAITSDFAVILTGFTNKSLLVGYGMDSGGNSTDMVNNNWKNGGMVGPYTVPWASKIVFTVPATAFNFPAAITRTIPTGISVDSVTKGDYDFFNMMSKSIDTDSYIDFNSIDITDYYVTHSSDFVGDPTLKENVNALELGTASCYNTLVAWYPGMTAAKINSATNAQIFPPALYGIKVTSTGNNQTIVPLDVAAPGTIKGFRTLTEAQEYTKLMKDNYAIYYNEANNSFSFVNNTVITPVNSKLEYLSAPIVKLTAGDTAVKLIGLSDSSGVDYSTSGSTGHIGSDFPQDLTWDKLLQALHTDATIDILGTRLHTLGQDLAFNNKIGQGSDYLDDVCSAKFTIGPALSQTHVPITCTTNMETPLATIELGKSIKAGTNFIEFTHVKQNDVQENIRLYICTESPGTTNIPVGSIGIGW